MPQGITYDSTLTPYAEYGMYMNINAPPSTIIGETLSQLSLNFVPGDDGKFNWIQLEGALAAKRIKP